MDISRRVCPQTVGATISGCQVLSSESHRESCWGCKLCIPPDVTFHALGVLGPHTINTLPVSTFQLLPHSSWEGRGALPEVKGEGNKGKQSSPLRRELWHLGKSGSLHRAVKGPGGEDRLEIALGSSLPSHPPYFHLILLRQPSVLCAELGIAGLRWSEVRQRSPGLGSRDQVESWLHYLWGGLG